MYTNHHCTEVLKRCDTYVHFLNVTAILCNLYFLSPAYSIGSVARLQSTQGNRRICFTLKHCCTFLNGETGKAATCSNEWNTASYKTQTYIAHRRFLELQISSIFYVWHSETILNLLNYSCSLASLPPLLFWSVSIAFPSSNSCDNC